METSLDIRGDSPPGIIDAFAANFAERGEQGAHFVAIKDGEVIADLHAGFADRAKTAPWTDKTLAAVYSAGKAAMATLVAEAVSAGEMDYDRAIAADWPEFSAEGKAAITLAQVLSHQAGLCGFPDPIPPEEWTEPEKIAARLAAMAPLWPPGSASGYHPQTGGYIVNEALFRRTGKTIGARLREKGYSIYCGMDATEMARTAQMQKPPSAPVHRNSPLTEIAFLKPWSASSKVSREQWMAAEIPSSNMHATARGLAEIIYPLASGGLASNGRRTIELGAVREALSIRSRGEDLVLPFEISWAAGLMANDNGFFGPSKSAFGHAGFGGAAVMVDPARRLAAGYVMNKMSPSLAGDPRAVGLFNALY